ncbi:glycosyltransferase family 4 protein [Rhodoferax sp. TS-BS-61-7]|uniref:glycosyltransferase family 4 protein n=1 Tax=Rhodoferax sp. TS-BS-61-7 TaxID=2094194 RepID=UPI000CF6A5C6|nr:glycosyltransferase family 4 protein [Rhodoferax sp. TS-BS-61-7]PQA77456.1 hypothetical protein C5F53_09410 [Rhodoferax sp. TS-BS-61-7]
MHIAIVGPIATNDIQQYLNGSHEKLPVGYSGAPLLASLIGSLIERGHTVSAITLSKDIALDEKGFVKAYGPNFSISYCVMRPRAWAPNRFMPGRIVDLFALEKRLLIAAINEAKPDVVHAHWAYEFGAAAISVKYPHVITSHDSPFDIARISNSEKLTICAYRWLRTLIAKNVLRRANYVTTVSPYLRDKIQPITRCKVQVIPNPVDDCALALAERRQSNNRPTIVMVCNGWDARKNPEPGLLAFTKLKIKMPGATMHLYGNDFGPNQTAETWCKAKGIENGMHFHGAVQHKQLLKELARHDLLLHTSIEESFGMVIAEAMAMGLPVVAGNASGAVPWVVGDSGMLCNIRDSDDIAAALVEALSAQRYAASSSSGIDSIKNRFTTTAVTNEFFAIYKAAISAWPTDHTNSATKGVVE